MFAPKLEFGKDQSSLHNMQDLPIDIARRLNGAPLVFGVETDSTTFTAGGSKIISHRLGRIPRGWTSFDVTGDYGVFQRTAWDDRTITIKSQNAVTAKFWVW